jgi:hypothetical protein
MRKYKLREDLKIEVSGLTLFRIECVEEFSEVKKGELGGYIEKEDNLSHEGNAWVYDDARVYGRAMVSGDTWVSDTARVSGNTRVSGNAMVFGSARVSDIIVTTKEAMF